MLEFLYDITFISIGERLLSGLLKRLRRLGSLLLLVRESGTPFTSTPLYVSLFSGNAPALHEASQLIRKDNPKSVVGR